MSNVPRVVIAEGDELKFVQLEFNGESYFRAGRENHGLVLSGLLNELGIHFKVMRVPSGNDYPLADGENYRATGMGMLTSNREGSWDAHGKSGDYGLYPDWDGLDAIAGDLPKNTILRRLG